MNVDKKYEDNYEYETRLSTLSQSQFNSRAREAKERAKIGRLPDYIPRLCQANPDWFAVQMQNINDRIYQFGDLTLSFPLMSSVKPFILLYLLEEFGAEMVFSRVGMDPSDRPFNSLEQLQVDGGFPRNPMINSGAIALCSILPGSDGVSRCETLRLWLNQQADCHLFFDQLMLASVQSLPNERNIDLATELAASGYLTPPKVTALDTYNRVCCLAGTVIDLVRLGLLLVSPRNGILPQHLKIVKALMSTCGLYELSGRFAVQVGIPTKSGVSGALLSVVPKEGAIACYSPPLDKAGNSVGGLFLLEKLAGVLNLSVFK